MHRVGIGGRMHRDGRNAELLAGAQHPERDLAAIGDQDFFEHGQDREWRMANGEWDSLAAGIFFTIRYSPFAIAATRPYSMIINGSPYSTGWPSSNRICVTVPPRGAGIWFMVFIASTISSGSPAFTTLPMSTNGFAVGSGAR